MRILLKNQNVVRFFTICLGLFLNTPAHAQDFELTKTKAMDGFYISVFSSNFTTNNTAVNDKLNFCIWRTITNNQAIVYMPTALEYVYQLDLLDTNGVALPKTELGKRIGVKFWDLEPSFANNTGFKLSREHTTESGTGIGAQWLFFPTKSGFGGQPIYSPNDLFEIKQPGNYTLRIRFQIIVASSMADVYKTAHIVRFPPLDYPLVKSASDLPPMELDTPTIAREMPKNL
jgi:hypothetical protein